MSEEFQYITSKTQTIEQIRVIETRAQKFPGYIGFSSTEVQRGYFILKELPDLFDIKDVHINDISVEGFLEIGKDKFVVLKEIFRKYEVAIGKDALITANCRYEDKNTKQSRLRSDSVNATIRRGKRFFGYFATSVLSLNKEHRRNQMERIITDLQLPLALTDEANDFFLAHTSGGELSICASGIKKENPYEFQCELPNLSSDELLNLLEKFLKDFSSGRLFEQSWSVSPCEKPGETYDADQVQRIYQFLVDSKFEATHHRLDVHFSIENLSCLDSVRNLCGKKDEVYSRLCSFDLSDSNYGEILILTKKEGHYLKFSMRLPENLEDVKSELGIELQELQAEQ